jgi:hypothetical protein
VRLYRTGDPANYWYTDGWFTLEEARALRNDAWKFGLSGDVLDSEGFMY